MRPLVMVAIFVALLVVGTPAEAKEEPSLQPPSNDTPHTERPGDDGAPDIEVGYGGGTDEDGSVSVGQGGSGDVQQVVDSGSDGGGSGGGGEASWPRCWWVEPGQQVDGPIGSQPSRRLDGDTIQVWEIELCQSGPDDPPSIRDRRWRDVVDIDDLIDAAFDDTPTPNPTINLSPNATDPGRYTLPGIPTWYWIPAGEWQPATASYTQSGYTATATAVPDRLDLAVAERTETETTVATCTGPGAEWQPGAGQHDTECWYQFTHASVYEGSGVWPGRLTIVWDGEWEIAGPGISLTGAVDDVKFTASTTGIRVGEIQPVIGPGD